MKRTSSPARPMLSTIEALEARIAPATLFIGKPGVSNEPRDAEYSDAPSAASKLGFIKMQGASDPISTTVGNTDANTYYLLLKAGDSVDLFNSTQPVQGYIQVKSGSVIAFFHDANGNNEYDRGELTGFSISDGSTLVFKDSLQGDVVENLTKDGKGIDMAHLQTGTGVRSLTFRSGDITGNVLVGSNLVSGSFNAVDGIFAGTAANAKAFDFFPALTSGNGTIAPLVPGAGKAGISIANVIVDRIGIVQTTPQIINHPVGTIQAGDGGAGGVGGGLNNIQVVGDTDGFNLLAGNGGNADSGLGRVNGGAGGRINGVYVAGVSDIGTPGHPSENSPILIKAGAGGNSIDGAGGAGGSDTSIFVGFRKLAGNQPQRNSDFLHDNVTVQAGDGGDGRIGGAGGINSTVRLILNTTGDLAAASEIAVISGQGGDALGSTAVRAGAGGLVRDVQILNLAVQDQPDPNGPPNTVTLLPNATLQVTAGSGGSTAGTTAVGGAGGAIASLQLLGSNLLVDAGTGSAGRIGGIGGSISSFKIIQDGDIFARTAAIHGGNGGDSALGSGARGGSVSNLTTDDADFGDLAANLPGSVFTLTAGNGGLGGKGAGGAGGVISGLQLFERDSRTGSDPTTRLVGTATIITGHGGDGSTVGGAGGALDRNTIDSEGLNITIAVGNGGSGTAASKASGGAGGRITSLNVDAKGDNVPDPADLSQFIEQAVSVSVTSGTGGNGGLMPDPSNLARGGAGGKVTSANLNSGGSASLKAGNGGNGVGGAAGTGASILLSGAFARNGDGSMIAGDAGVTGLKPGAGGSITGTDSVHLSGVFGTGNVTMQAGDGGHGGAGGALRYVGYGSSDSATTPTGNILVSAGDGSAEGVFAGAGGSILNLNGSVSSGSGFSTIIQAGKGGGSTAKSAAGGSITNLTIQGGPQGNFGGVVTIAAGDAGNAGVLANTLTGSVGANGGSVNNVTILDIGQATTLRSIAGGDAGSGAVRGGIGGSIKEVHVLAHDIGVKSGQAYGYSTMGGLFAGLGGHSATVDAKAGVVSSITADSISAIVAGKAAAPGLAELVERITLNSGPTLPPALSTSASSSFQLTFHPIVDYTVDVGTPANPTTQTFTRLLGGSGPGKQPPGGPTTFTLSYNGQTSISLDANESAANIQLALDAIVPGGTTVTDNGNGTFTVVIQSGVSSGPITGVGVEKTAVLKGNALPSQVRTALNALPNIDDSATGNGKFDGVDVIATPTNNFQVTFRNTGDVGDITAERLFAGVTTVPVPGGLGQVETQNVDVLGVGDFTLTFGVSTTPRLAATADAAVVEGALNLLPDVISAGGVTVSAGQNGSYDIHFKTAGSRTPVTAAEFSDILTGTSRQGGYDTIESVHGDAGVKEEQTFRPPDSGVYRLTFEGQTTTQAIASNADAATVAQALNGLQSVAAVNGVTVTGDNLTGFTVKFNDPSDRTPIHVNALEKQTVNFPLLRYGNGNGLVFQVTDTTTGSPVVSSVTLPGDATAAEVQAALNGLPAINDNIPGNLHDGVTVSLTADNTFTIAFNNTADDTKIDIAAFQHLPAVSSHLVVGQNTPPADVQTIQNGDGSTQEVQQFTKASSGTYTLSFNGVNTNPISAAATASQVQGELNGIGDIAAAGGVVVTPSGSDFIVTFNTPADQPAIQIAYVSQEVQRIDVTNIGNFTLGLDFASTETTPGDAATHEVQHITPVQTTTGFTLTFNGQTTPTALPANATAAQVQAALNAMRPIIDAGTVTVTGDAAAGYDVTFGQNGNVGPLTGRSVTDSLLPTASPAVVKTQLDALFGTPVTVTGGANGIYDVAFPNPGAQPLVAVDETRALTPPTGPVVPATVKLQIARADHSRDAYFTPNEFAAAHIVGAIADFNELGADVFKYIDTNNDGFFTVGDNSGDIPIDGLLAAKTFNPNAPTNFTPQARFVLNVVQPNRVAIPATVPFFDFNNQI